MQESSVEKYLVGRVKELGGRAYKFVSPGNAGVPDRIICLPGRQVVFVELKAPGKKLRPLQIAAQAKIRAMGFPVFTIDNMSGVDDLIEKLKKEMMPK